MGSVKYDPRRHRKRPLGQRLRQDDCRSWIDVLAGRTWRHAACRWRHHLGIADKIEYCVDSTPQKQGRYIPGTNIRILPVSELKNQTVLLTAWNYEREIRQMITNKLINPFR